MNFRFGWIVVDESVPYYAHRQKESSINQKRSAASTNVMHALVHQEVSLKNLLRHWTPFSLSFHPPFPLDPFVGLQLSLHLFAEWPDPLFGFHS